ncbi:MAG: NAD(P)/FAD-dependent oxidoreductase [Gammaproteobacteria bacterium]
MRVVICGAGVVGASVAYFLARRGVGVTLVERVRPACAASGKSGGFLALDWCDGSPQAGLARASFALHAELAQTLDADYGYRRMDTFMVASSDVRDVSHLRRMSAPDWLDGDCAVAGAIGTPTTTAQVHPRRFTEALVEAAVQSGATLLRGTVQALTTSADDSAACGIVVDGNTIEADAIVVAMGPWCMGLAEALSLPAVSGLKGYSITLRPESPVPAHALFVDYELENGEQPAPEVVPRPDGEVYICGLSDDDPVPADPERVRVDDYKCSELRRMAGRLSKALSGAAMLSRHACYRPICADAMPIIGPTPAVEGVYVATAHNCWGMLNAPGTGLAMSELLIDGRASSIDLAPFDPARLSI